MSSSCNFSASMTLDIASYIICNESNLKNASFTSDKKDVLWYTRAVLLISIMILAILGNLIVLAATWIEGNLHEPNKYFIACLAVADFFVGIVTCPFLVHQHFNKSGITSIHLCQFWIWIDVVAETVSIYTLTFISFDRYLKLSQPFKYNSLMTTSKSFIVICVVWFISTFWAVFGMFSYTGRRGIYIDPIKGCTNDNVIFYTASPLVAFFVPTIITLVMYVRILSIAHKRRKMARNGDFGLTSGDRNQRASFYQDFKNIRMLAVVMGTFIICWGPFFTLMILHFHYPGFYVRNDWAFIIIQMLPCFNSVCNPIIYACLDKKYTEAFKRLCKRMKCW